MWTQSTKPNGQAETAEPKYVHSTPDDETIGPILGALFRHEKNGSLRAENDLENDADEPMTYQVYRPRDKNLSDWAGEILMRWGNQDEGNTPKYNFKGAITSGMTPDGYDKKAQRRAEDVSSQAFETMPDWTKKDGVFCSQAVLSAYQAAHLQISSADASNNEMPNFLRADSKRVSPRTLEHLFKNNNSEIVQIGKMKIDANSLAS